MTTIQQKFLKELKNLFDKYKVRVDDDDIYCGEDEIYSETIYTIKDEDGNIDIEMKDLQLYLFGIEKNTDL